MSQFPVFEFELLVGYGSSTNGIKEKGICSANVKLDAVGLGRKPLTLDSDSVKASYANVYDIVALPVLRKGVPAVMTATNDAVLFLNYQTLQQMEKIDLPLPKLGNWHGIEIIDDEFFAVADSKGSLYLVNASDQKWSTLSLPAAHQVLWDTTTAKLFALGKAQLEVYTFDSTLKTLKPYGKVDFSELYAEMYNDFSTDKGDNWADGGHDLYFSAGERRMYLTTGERAYLVDIDALLYRLSLTANTPQVWQLDQLFAQDIIQPAWGMYQVRSDLSDSYTTSAEQKNWRPPNKGGCKSLCKVPGTSVQIAHSAPDYYRTELAPSATNLLIVSRGPADRPNLYLNKKKPYETLKIVLNTQGDHGNSTTYRTRVKPELPAGDNTPLWWPDDVSDITLSYSGMSGSLGKVGAPYLLLNPNAEQLALQNLYYLMKPDIPKSDLNKTNIYGFCVINAGGVKRDALFHLTGKDSVSEDGVIVDDALGLRLAVYTWATPVKLHWECTNASSITGQLLDSDNQRRLDALWVSINGEPAVEVNCGIDHYGRQFTIALDKDARSVALFAKTDEGYWSCSGERQR